MYRGYKDSAPVWIMFLLLIGAIAFLIFAQVSVNNEYNHGIHAKDGGHWVYRQMISRGKYGNTTYYVYQCDVCGERIESLEEYAEESKWQ